MSGERLDTIFATETVHKCHFIAGDSSRIASVANDNLSIKHSKLRTLVGHEECHPEAINPGEAAVRQPLRDGRTYSKIQKVEERDRPQRFEAEDPKQKQPSTTPVTPQNGQTINFVPLFTRSTVGSFTSLTAPPGNQDQYIQFYTVV